MSDLGGIVLNFKYRQILVMAIVLLTQTASADMITQNVSWGSGGTPWSGTNLITQFDPALGTLNSVQLDFSGYSWGDLTLQNWWFFPVTQNSHLGAQITLADALQNPILTVLPTTAFTDRVSGWGGTRSHTVLEGNAAVDNASFTYTSDFSRWIGSGNWWPGPPRIILRWIPIS